MQHSERPRTRKSRNLMMSCPPAHASQSWNEGKDQKIRRDINRNRNNVNSFDTPCSMRRPPALAAHRRYIDAANQSWDEGKGQRIQRDINRNRITVNSKSFDTPCQRHTAMRKQMQRRFLGPDPTVPHLKYGIFPKKPNCVPAKIEIQMNQPVRPLRIEPYTRKIKRPPKKPLIVKESKPVISDNLPRENRLLGQLTISTSTHVDIKPQSFTRPKDKTILKNKNYYS